MSKEISKNDKKLLKELRSKSQNLKSVVIIGSKGLTESVKKEIYVALKAHELIKLKINLDDKLEIKNITEFFDDSEDINMISNVGKTLVLYKSKED